ncbi:MAG TPA: glycosyltransferase family 39 protein [Anaerolineales bacterium]|nr:glycosyltransferase family 39 protein [Anaerolineales bacterium]
MKRSIAVALFLLWTGLIITAYYVVQKPGLLHAFTGLAGTLWTLIIAAFLLFNSYGLGTQVLFWLGLKSVDAVDRLPLGCGVGLGALGLLGLGVSAAQLASQAVFSFLLLISTTILLFNNAAGRLRADLGEFAAYWNLSFSQYSPLTRTAILLPFVFSFLLTLAPQFEAFDALLYHLTQPARVLQDGGLRPIDVPHFWFPNLTENLYLWALALGSERAAQILHLAWGTLCAFLLWRWAVKIWDVETGRKTLLLLAAIPSLPMLASWAYADLALAFYAAAALYTLTFHESTGTIPWLRIAGIFAGLAMGVKYTSFTVPLTVGLLLLFWGRKSFGQALLRAAQFALIALTVALPWYARNAILMGNPFYPFAFGGRYWDAFRSQWYAGAGTGLGQDMLEIFLLPLNVVLGYRDENFFDGRTGPLFLILAPVTLWILLSRVRRDSDRGLSLQAIGLFAALSFAAWTLGVIKTSSLWQARLLFPALLPFAIPTALGWDAVRQLDTSRLRPSFLLNVIVAVILALTLFDNSLFVLQRNPLAVASGVQSREAYIARVNPSYAALIELTDTLPPEACIYSLFEPRSYGLPRCTQPDPINDNFSHDLHLHKTPAAVIQHWRTEGYTHILLYERALQFGAQDPANKLTPARREALRETLENLELVARTPGGAYTIYRIP